MARPILHWQKFIPWTEYFRNTKVAGLVEIFVQQKNVSYRPSMVTPDLFTWQHYKCLAYYRYI